MEGHLGYTWMPYIFINPYLKYGETHRIVLDGKKVGGVVIKVEGEKGDLDLLFIAPSVHSKGI